MKLGDIVSETALITLRARVAEAQRPSPLIVDEVGARLLDAIETRLRGGSRPGVLQARLPHALTNHIALRARHYDRCAAAFLAQHQGGLIVDLGSGFDTRYWRIAVPSADYVEVDLPDVVAAKQQLLAQPAPYRSIGCSVLDDAWLRQVRDLQDHDVLLLAEGLLMYLPVTAVRELFARLTAVFRRSQIVFEVVAEKYTRGVWKTLVAAKMRRSLGTAAGSAYQFGVRHAEEIEDYAAGLRVIDEWSYFEDPDIWPAFLHRFRRWRWLTRTQWTIRASLGPP